MTQLTFSCLTITTSYLGSWLWIFSSDLWIPTLLFCSGTLSGLLWKQRGAVHLLKQVSFSSCCHICFWLNPLRNPLRPPENSSCRVVFVPLLSLGSKWIIYCCSQCLHRVHYNTGSHKSFHCSLLAPLLFYLIFISRWGSARHLLYFLYFCCNVFAPLTLNLHTICSDSGSSPSFQKTDKKLCKYLWIN